MIYQGRDNGFLSPSNLGFWQLVPDMFCSFSFGCSQRIRCSRQPCATGVGSAMRRTGDQPAPGVMPLCFFITFLSLLRQFCSFSYHFYIHAFLLQPFSDFHPSFLFSFVSCCLQNTIVIPIGLQAFFICFHFFWCCCATSACSNNFLNIFSRNFFGISCNRCRFLSGIPP